MDARTIFSSPFVLHDKAWSSRKRCWGCGSEVRVRAKGAVKDRTTQPPTHVMHWNDPATLAGLDDLDALIGRGCPDTNDDGPR